MVFFAEKRRRDEAACCRVEVMKGGRGLFCLTCFFTFSTAIPRAFLIRSATAWEAASSGISFGSTTLAENASPPGVRRSASMVQYSWETNLSISSWRMQMSRTATDCTLPPERPRFTRFHRSGLMV